MKIDGPLYYASNCILRKEYFGGIVFLVDRARYLEVNYSAYQLLKALGPGPIFDANLNNLYKIAEPHVVFEFLQQCLQFGIIGKVATIKTMRVIENTETSSYISSPIEAYLYLTHTCNQNCPFCYFRKSVYEDTLSIGDWCNLIDQFIALGVCTLGFLGGEPLMKKDLLLKLLEYVNNKMWCTITSNGTACGGFDKDFVKELARFHALEVNISIEAYDSHLHDTLVGTAGSFQMAMTSLQNLITQGIHVAIKTIATQQNYHSIYDLAKKMKGIGANGIYILDYMPSYGESFTQYSTISVPNNEYWETVRLCESLADDSFFVLSNTKYRFTRGGEYFAHEAKDLLYHASKCAAGSINLDIMPNGDAYSCPLTNGIERYCLGNAKNIPISSIWHNKSLLTFRQRNPDELENENCKKCKNRNTCIGGCPIASEIFTGSIYGGDRRCPIASLTSET